MKKIFLIIVTLSFHGYLFSQNDTVPHKHELKEVVVTATKTLSRFDSDGFITTVTGTPLQSLTSANELLGYLPGVINNNGSIEVVGKGQPVIYINGRKLLNMSELDQLSAAKIKEVKVITNPGARYGNEVNSVIRISTVKDLGEGFSLANRAVVGIKDYFYGNDMLDMNFRTGGLDVFTTLVYNYNKGKGSREDIQYFWGSKERINSRNANARKHIQRLEGKIGINYVSANGHVFGAFYQNTYNPSKTNTFGNSSNTVNESIPTESKEENFRREKYYEHLVEAYYSGRWNKWDVTANFDYLWKKNNELQQIREETSGMTLSELQLRDKSCGRMFAGELHFSKSVGNGSLQFGSEYTNTDRIEYFYSHNSSFNSVDNEIKENNISIYAQISHTFGPLMLQAGLRYEYINSNYYEVDFKKNEQSRHYNEVLPSFSMTLPVKKTMFQLSYSRSFNRPLYAQLSSAVHYADQFTYETGNPNLKNAFTDNVTLNFRYSWLMVMTTYKHIHNRIVTMCSEYESNPDVTLFTKANSKRDADNLEIIVSAMPGFIGGFYYPAFMAGVVAQFYDIDYRNSVKSMNRPMWLVRWNNIFRLPKNFMIYANLKYMSGSDSDNIYAGHTCQLDLSVSKTFNRHWDVKLAFNDILNTARKRDVSIYSGLYNLNSIRRNTIRGAELTIGYKFNTVKSKYQGKGAGNKEKSRL